MQIGLWTVLSFRARYNGYFTIVLMNLLDCFSSYDFDHGDEAEAQYVPHNTRKVRHFNVLLVCI